MFANIPQKIVHRAKRFIFRPRVSIRHPQQMVTMGTLYGGWSFIDHPGLTGATIVSAGLGEDASFDTEFANRYRGTVIIVDPTPRAVAHYDALCARLGKTAETGYVPGGKQPVKSYPLGDLDAGNFELIQKALWTSETTIKFFQPPNPAHVSYSITNFQNNYSQDTAYIEVPTVKLKDLLSERRIENLELIKLDIEGAETDVIYGMLADGILPNQILVEFDELTIPSRASTEKFVLCDAALRRHGYECVYWNGRADFAYAHGRLLQNMG